MSPKKELDQSNMTFINVTNGDIYRKLISLEKKMEDFHSFKKWAIGGMSVLFTFLLFMAKYTFE